MNDKLIKAVIKLVEPEGKYAAVSIEGFDSLVTFTLDPRIWKGEEVPRKYQIVLITKPKKFKLKDKKEVWRTTFARPWEIKDENNSNIVEDIHEIMSLFDRCTFVPTIEEQFLRTTENAEVKYCTPPS